MKSNQLAKTRVAQAEQESPETPRPIWFLGKELKDEPQDKPEADKAAEPAAKASKPKKPERKAAGSKETAQEEVPESAMGPAERRPTQLEAYMRYAKMREPREDEALAPIGTKRFPSGRHDAANEDGMGWDEEMPRRRPQRRAASGLRVRDAVLAGIASIAIGTLAGAIVYDRTNDGALSTAAFDSIGGFLTGLNAPPNNAMARAGTSTVETQSASASFKKPVTTARLDVADAKGNVNSLIPLSISAEPALPDQDIALRLSGLPADAYLTAGTKLANNAWILKPGEELGVKLMVPSAQASPLLIAVEAIEAQTGDLAAPTEEINVALSNTTATSPPPPQQVEPASAPATDVKRNFNLPAASQHESAAAQPIPTPLESTNKTGAADSATLMRNGDKLLGVGDFTAARAFFSKARDLGNREASLRLGQTYDPVIFRERNVQGLKPDPAMALKYYLEARTAGIEDANSAITGLETWMKQ